MKERKSKALADGAVCTALTVLLMIIAVYVPIFALFSVAVVGLPLVFLEVRSGLRIAVIAAVASALVLFLLTGNLLAAAVMSVLYLLPGLAVGYTISRRAAFRTHVFAASAAILIGLLLQLLLLNASVDGNGIEAMLDSTIAMTREILGRQEQLASLSEVIEQALAMVRELFLLYLPSMVIAIAAGMGYALTAAAVFMLRRLRVSRVPYLPFCRLCAPRSMCYLAMILYMIAAFSSDNSVYTAALKNVVLLLNGFIGVCGLSLIDYKFREKLASGYARAGIYAVVFLVGYVAIGILGQVLMFLGLLDGLFRFRQPYKVGGQNGEDQ